MTTTDLEKAEAVVRMVREKRAQLVQQRSAWCDERDDVALRAYVGDRQARKRLDEINVALSTHSELELAAIDAALKAAGAVVAAAKQVVADDEGHRARARARSILKELAACGPQLDRVVEHPDGSGPYSPADPQAVAKDGGVCGFPAGRSIGSGKQVRGGSAEPVQALR
jgi:hypothetical protein